MARNSYKLQSFKIFKLIKDHNIDFLEFLFGKMHYQNRNESIWEAFLFCKDMDVQMAKYFVKNVVFEIPERVLRKSNEILHNNDISGYFDKLIRIGEEFINNIDNVSRINEMLMNSPFLVHYRDSNKFGGLHFASINNNFEIVELLVSKGSIIDMVEYSVCLIYILILPFILVVAIKIQR